MVKKGMFSVMLLPFGVLGHQLVGRAQDLLERGGEVAVFLDVADELLRQEHLARRQVEHLQLLAEVVVEPVALDGDRLDVFLLLVFLPGPTGHIETVEEDLLPVGLVLLGLLLLLFLLGLLGLLDRLLLLGLDQLEERDWPAAPA